MITIVIIFFIIFVLVFKYTKKSTIVGIKIKFSRNVLRRAINRQLGMSSLLQSMLNLYNAKVVILMAKTRIIKGNIFNIKLRDNFRTFLHASKPYPANMLKEKDVRTNIRDGGLVEIIGIGSLNNSLVKNQSIVVSIVTIANAMKKNLYFFVS